MITFKKRLHPVLWLLLAVSIGLVTWVWLTGESPSYPQPPPPLDRASIAAAAPEQRCALIAEDQHARIAARSQGSWRDLNEAKRTIWLLGTWDRWLRELEPARAVALSGSRPNMPTLSDLAQACATIGANDAATIVLQIHEFSSKPEVAAGISVRDTWLRTGRRGAEPIDPLVAEGKILIQALAQTADARITYIDAKLNELSKP